MFYNRRAVRPLGVTCRIGETGLCPDDIVRVSTLRFSVSLAARQSSARLSQPSVCVYVCADLSGCLSVCACSGKQRFQVDLVLTFVPRKFDHIFNFTPETTFRCWISPTWNGTHIHHQVRSLFSNTNRFTGGRKMSSEITLSDKRFLPWHGWHPGAKCHPIITLWSPTFDSAGQHFVHLLWSAQGDNESGQLLMGPWGAFQSPSCRTLRRNKF